ncbi:MAG: molybdopterin-guanine dinucleotide biosynthesis protein B [Pseudomonadota bacterium]
MIVYGVVGWKNAGKTTLVERLVAEIAGRGYSVSTLKHTHHGVDVDRPGKDSHRHRAAGARQVILASSARWALMTELRGAPEPPLEDLVARLDPVDLVIVEGYKRDRHPKIEAWRAETGQPLIARDDPTVRAIASKDTLPDGPGAAAALPVIDLDDIAAIADFLLADAGLAPRVERPGAAE